MRNLKGKQQTKDVKFAGEKLSIRKLSAGAVKRIGEESRALEAAAKSAEGDSDDSILGTIAVIINEGVVVPEGDAPMTVQDLEDFALDDLNKLASDIMEYAGLNLGKDKGNAA